MTATPDGEKLLWVLQIASANLDAGWTFLLILTRFTGLFIVLPGLGGNRGAQARVPGLLMFAGVSMISSPYASMPADWISAIGSLLMELLLGFGIGLLVTFTVVAVQTGVQIAAGTMGLSAGNLVDPTTGGSMTQLAKLHGDVVILMFLLLGGHYTVIYAVAGLSGGIVPGSFIVGPLTIDLLVDRSGNMFELGTIVAGPVLVALLLTQFVMGLMTKAVPTVNIFIVSFPLTIGIGLILSVFALPEIVVVLERVFADLDVEMGIMLSDSVRQVQ